MATYFVAKTGSDGSSGSQAYPWLTVARAALAVNPGDTVLIKAGLYNEIVSIERSGTPSSWINFRAAPGEHVVLDGTGFNELDYYPRLSHIGILNASYIALEDIESINSFCAGVGSRGECHFLVFRNLYLHECQEGGIMCMYDWGTQNIELHTDILIAGVSTERTNKNPGNQEGISLIGVNRFEVKYSRMLTQYHQAGLTCKESTSNGRIHHCLFNQHNTNGIYLDAGYNMSGPTRNIEIDHNIFKHVSLGVDMQAEAANTDNLHLHNLENINVHHNLIYDMHTDAKPPASLGTFWGGMNLGHNAGGLGAPPHKNVQVHDNIIVAYYAHYSSGIIFTAPKLGYENCGFKNNIIINLAGYEMFITHPYSDLPGPGLTIDNNRFYTPGGTYIEDPGNDPYIPGENGGGNMFGTNAQLGFTPEIMQGNCMGAMIQDSDANYVLLALVSTDGNPVDQVIDLGGNYELDGNIINTLHAQFTDGHLLIQLHKAGVTTQPSLMGVGIIGLLVLLAIIAGRKK